MKNNYGQDEYIIYYKMINRKNDYQMGIFYAYDENEALNLFYEKAEIDNWEKDSFYAKIKED